jgi:MFS family permease
MAAIPPTGNLAVSGAELPWWALIGPALATITSFFTATSVYEAGRVSHMMMDIGVLPREFLLVGVLPYLLAAAITFAPGFLLGGRFPTALLVPALGLMIIGVFLTSFASGGTILLVGRAISGLGAGVAVGVAVAVVRRIMGPRAVAATAVAALGALAAVAAPFVNRALSEATSFRIAYLATVLFLFIALFASAVSGIVRAVTANRPTRSGPYGMPYPAPYPAPQHPAPYYPAAPHPPQAPGR